MSEKGVDNAAFVESSVEMSGQEIIEAEHKEEKGRSGDDKTDAMAFEKTASATGLTNEEEKMLDMLREIVRKTTLADPDKRPTARELLEMLDSIPE